MKGTLISNDFVKDRNGDLKFLEMNTDTVLYGNFLKHDADWGALVSFLNADAGFNTLHIIYKAELHLAAVQDIKSKVAAGCSGITAITLQNEALHNSFPTAVEDAANKFILRLAYDENAILDSYYAASAINPLALFEENGSGSLAVPFYSVDGGIVTSTLVSSSNAANIPDVVYKPKMDVFGPIEFGKVGDWDTAKSELTGSYYMTSYETHADDIAAGIMKSYRNYGIAYGGGLNYIDLGTITTQAKFDIPSAAGLDWDGTSNWKFGLKHRMEYSTSTWKTKDVKDGMFENETYTSASAAEEAVGIHDIRVGQTLKTFYVPGLPDTDIPDVYLSWNMTGSQWPEGTAVTSSVVQTAVYTNQNLSGELYRIETADTDFYIGGSTAVLAHNYESTEVGVTRYTPVFEINQDYHSLIALDGSKIPIVKSELLQLSVATGSFFTADVESVDNLLVGDQSFAFVTHNAKGFI